MNHSRPGERAQRSRCSTNRYRFGHGIRQIDCIGYDMRLASHHTFPLYFRWRNGRYMCHSQAFQGQVFPTRRTQFLHRKSPLPHIHPSTSIYLCLNMQRQAVQVRETEYRRHQSSLQHILDRHIQRSTHICRSKNFPGHSHGIRSHKYNLCCRSYLCSFRTYMSLHRHNFPHRVRCHHLYSYSEPL
jgi:hypothetical protein